MLDGLMSRWMIPFWWACWIAWQTVMNNSTAGEGLAWRLDLTGRFCSYLLLLPCLLEPLLIFRCLLPALVGQAGADQAHIGPQVLAVLAGAVAGAVRPEAKVFRRHLLGHQMELGKEIAARVANAA